MIPSFLLWALAVRVCQYSLLSLYRFLGNALCILLSICVDHFLRTDFATQSIRDPDQKQAWSDGFPLLFG